MLSTEKNNTKRVSDDRRSLSKEISRRKEIYRQLKYAMEKNGDRPLALEFQSIEMDYYRKLINIRKDRSLSDRFILWSSLSNNFGQNFWRPTWLLILATSILYVPIAFCASKDLQFVPAHSASQAIFTFRELFWNQLKLFPQLLNPVHNLSAIVENIKTAPGIIYFFDFIERIITAYFVFQIVTAFRKYVR